MSPYVHSAHPSRFQLARRSPEFDAAMNDLPTISAAGRVAWALVAEAAALAYFVYVCSWAFDARIPWKGLPPVVIGIRVGAPLLVGAIAAWAAAYLRRQLRFQAAPVEPRLAVVVDERTRVRTHGSAEDSYSYTEYYATLEDENGEREELSCNARLAGSIARGDIGVAYVKLDELVGFWRLRDA